MMAEEEHRRPLDQRGFGMQVAPSALAGFGVAGPAGIAVRSYA